MKYTKEQLEKAENYAFQQLDHLNHSSGYYNLKDYVYFYHNGKMIIDPWQNEIFQYGDCMWPEYDEVQRKHIGEHVVEPYEYYGEDNMNEYVRKILCMAEGLHNRI